MTKLEIRNNMAYASHMQFEVLRRALWAQQAQPQTVFNWQFWERAAQDPKMTSYLTHGVKAKMRETTPFVNTVGAHYVASRAQIEEACDSLRQQGSSKVSTIGLSKVDVCASTALTEFPSCTIAEALLVPKTVIWSTMVMHTSPFKSDILQNVYPHHEVLLSCKPHRPRCHQWRPLQPQVHDDVQDFQPDVIVERYLDAKYYHYDPEEIYDMCDYNCNATYLAESDHAVTLTAMETDESSMLASIHDNFRELETTVPEWEEKETQTIHPKWLEHHQSGHLTQRSRMSSVYGRRRQQSQPSTEEDRPSSRHNAL